MNSNHQQSPGFFPNLFSVVVFTIILSGMFLGFTRIYPQLISYYLQDDQPDLGEASNVPLEIAPFVRGIIAGMTASQTASTRSDQPLDVNKLKGYESGIKTALLASKNWYNIDQQLFRTRGIALGVTASVESSKTERQRGTQAYQIKLIQKIEAALATDLQDLLSTNADNREAVLRNYLNNLKKLAGEAAIELANLDRVRTEASTQAQTQTGIVQEYDESFIYNLEPTDDKGLEAYLRARNQLDQSSVTIRFAEQLLTRLSPLNIRLNQLITAIEANFQALSTGTRVAPVQGVNLPIFQEQ